MSPLDVQSTGSRFGAPIIWNTSGTFTPAFGQGRRTTSDADRSATASGSCSQISDQARRIVADVTVGQQAVAGERFGMIKFGSRVDVLLPLSATVNVRINDRTLAGQTVIAELSQSA